MKTAFSDEHHLIPSVTFIALDDHESLDNLRLLRVYLICN